MKEILIKKGKTFAMEVRWGVEPFIYKAITAISLTDGPPRLTVPGHGMPDKWKGAIIRVEGMTEINASKTPPGDSDQREFTVIDANTLELNEVDPTGFSPYSSGGFVVFKTPNDLTGYSSRMDVKGKIGGAVLISSEADAAPLDVIDLAVDQTNHVTTMTIAADATAALTFKKGVADLEMVSPTGVVTKLKLCSGNHEDPDPVRVIGEITT